MAAQNPMNKPSILAITGGVGGAKLCLGLADELGDSPLHIMVNTGDDFQHLGLHISPDIDTLLYTLSGRSNEQQGWGLASESWIAMTALERLGGETWFRLGDQDLATHLWRTNALAKGMRLSTVVDELATGMSIQANIYPMTDDTVQTIVCTHEQELAFQHYFVRLQCQPAVIGFRFQGIESARPNPAVLQLLNTQAPAAIIICPSNPFVSIDPVLNMPGMWQALRDCPAPVTAVSPIVAGLAVKGPAAKMMQELNMPVSALAVANYYCECYPGLLTGFVLDDSDADLAPEIRHLGLDVTVTKTIMKTRGEKQQLAQFMLNNLGFLPSNKSEEQLPC